MLARKRQREDFEHEDDGGLHNVKGARIPDGDDRRVYNVGGGIPRNANRVPDDLDHLQEEGRSLKGRVRILIHPEKPAHKTPRGWSTRSAYKGARIGDGTQLVHNKEHEDHGDERAKLRREAASGGDAGLGDLQIFGKVLHGDAELGRRLAPRQAHRAVEVLGRRLVSCTGTLAVGVGVRHDFLILKTRGPVADALLLYDMRGMPNLIYRTR